MAKWNLLKKATFKHCLKVRIKKYGYWSEEVLMLNSEVQGDIPYHIWLKWHDEVREELRLIKTNVH